MKKGVMKLNLKAIQKLESLRVELFGQIKANLMEDGYCKNTEGRFSILYPDYHEANNKESEWTVELYCYVVGPSRSYLWTGSTLIEAVNKAEKEIKEWIKEDKNRMLSDPFFSKDDIDSCYRKAKRMVSDEWNKEIIS